MVLKKPPFGGGMLAVALSVMRPGDRYASFILR